MGTFDFVEGFDYYPNGLNTNGVGVHSTWITFGSQEEQPRGLVDGRFAPGKAYQLFGPPNSLGEGRSARIVPASAQKAFGFACRLPNVGSRSNINPGPDIIRLHNSAEQTLFSLNVTGYGEVKASLGKNDAGQVKGVCPRLMASNTWHYIEVELLIADANGYIRVYIDGEQQFEFVGDTKSQEDGNITRFCLTVIANSGIQQYDDMYCMSNQATRLGESRILLLEAVSDFDVDFERSAGPSNFGNIDDDSTDNDATYNFSAVEGARDLFNMTQVDVNPVTIHAVGLITAARKEDSGTRTIRNLLNLDGLDAATPGYNLTTDYTWNRTLALTAPDGSPWTKAKVNNLKMGYELVMPEEPGV